LGGKPEGKESLWKYVLGWEDNIKIAIQYKPTKCIFSKLIF
jgi:hypothetical protein